MIEFLQFTFQNFWTWLGVMILIGVPVNFCLRVISRLIRSSNIKAKGWPPPHLDADGDFKPEPKDE